MPQLDVFGYRSPRTPGPRTGFRGYVPTRLAGAGRARPRRARGGEAGKTARRQREEARRQRESPRSQSAAPMVRGGCYPQVMPQHHGGAEGWCDEGWSAAPPVTPPSGPRPGERGAVFEVRTVRAWARAVARKKRVWRQNQRLAHGTTASGRDGRQDAGRGGAVGSDPHHRPG